MSFTSTAKKYPPVLCRLLARNRRNALSNWEFFQRVTLTAFEIEQISRLTSWDNVPFGTMQKFLKGCGIDFENWRQMGRLNDFIKSQANQGSPWRHLRKSREWLSYYEPLLKLYVRSLK